MNAVHICEFLARSFGVGAVACVMMLSLRRASRGIRTTVIIIAWAAMAVVALECVVPLPKVQLGTPVELATDRASIIPARLQIVWLAGMIALLVRESVGVYRLRRMILDAEPIGDSGWKRQAELGRRALGLSMPIELRWSDRIGPCAAGGMRPVILLPRSAAAWTEEMRAQVILHELAHFRRRDLWMLMAVRFVAAVHWFNPLTLLLRRWMYFQELACDALVVQHRGDAVAYAESLLALASAPSPIPFVPVLTLLPRRQSQIEIRIRQLLAADGMQVRRWRLLEAAFATGVFLLLVACSISGSAMCSNVAGSDTSEVELRLSADPFPGEQ